MLSCHDLANKVASNYVDGQLRWHERLTVRFHLAICDNCRRFIKQLKLVRTIIRKHERIYTPPHNRKKILHSRCNKLLPCASPERG